MVSFEPWGVLENKGGLLAVKASSCLQCHDRSGDRLIPHRARVLPRLSAHGWRDFGPAMQKSGLRMIRPCRNGAETTEKKETGAMSSAIIVASVLAELLVQGRVPQSNGMASTKLGLICFTNASAGSSTYSHKRAYIAYESRVAA